MRASNLRGSPKDRNKKDAGSRASQGTRRLDGRIIHLLRLLRQLCKTLTVLIHMQKICEYLSNSSQIVFTSTIVLFKRVHSSIFFLMNMIISSPGAAFSLKLKGGDWFQWQWRSRCARQRKGCPESNGVLIASHPIPHVCSHALRFPARGQLLFLY